MRIVDMFFQHYAHMSLLMLSSALGVFLGYILPIAITVPLYLRKKKLLWLPILSHAILGTIIASYPLQDAFSTSHFMFDITFVFLLLTFHFGILVLSVAFIMYSTNKFRKKLQK